MGSLRGMRADHDAPAAFAATSDASAGTRCRGGRIGLDQEAQTRKVGWC
jgi:hypothetical protein